MGGPFSAHAADLLTLWKVKKAAKKLRDRGSLTVSDEGYVFWSRGAMWFSLCQFRDNILFASNLSPGSKTTLVQEMCSTLSDIWNLEVLCDCLGSRQTVCIGQCLVNTARALGIYMTVGRGTSLCSTQTERRLGLLCRS